MSDSNQRLSFTSNSLLNQCFVLVAMGPSMVFEALGAWFLDVWSKVYQALATNVIDAGLTDPLLVPVFSRSSMVTVVPVISVYFHVCESGLVRWYVIQRTVALDRAGRSGRMGY